MRSMFICYIQPMSTDFSCSRNSVEMSTVEPIQRPETLTDLILTDLILKGIVRSNE